MSDLSARIKGTMTETNLAPTIAAIYGFDRRSELKRPLFACGVSAGFPLSFKFKISAEKLLATRHDE